MTGKAQGNSCDQLLGVFPNKLNGNTGGGGSSLRRVLKDAGGYTCLSVPLMQAEGPHRALKSP